MVLFRDKAITSRLCPAPACFRLGSDATNLPAGPRVILIVSLLLVILLTACASPAYYLQATFGQMKLMRVRQDIQSILDDPATDAELSADLEAAEQIKAFAYSTLNLPDSGSYSSYVKVETDAIVWNVIATPEFSLQPRTWCFPVAGCVPYRGFFKQQKALESAVRLRKKGMDVVVSPAAAYSTLGWFKDPLLSTMTSGSDVRLAAYLFHELAHQRLYLKDDGAFNEAYASFVEDIGVEKWLNANQRQTELLKWQQLQDANRDFGRLIAHTRDELAALYASTTEEAVKRSRKSEIFISLSRTYNQWRKDKWQNQPYYDHWFEKPLNNAKIALHDTYEGGQCAFMELFDKAHGDMQEFHRLAEQQSRLQRDNRQLWLKQSCANMESPGN